ncbi:hypothetical protein CANARDRAFT_180666, partial [[Candida] arabinofermentans NRRL YB-2248]
HVPLSEGEFYMYMLASITLVLLGGIFAGLTLGLMGQDEVYLKVMADSGTPEEQRHSKDVLRLISRGKHWLLVTLLLSNVITNETLPVILDRFLGGGFAAVFSATVSIVIFGEIIPQSVCVRYGLQLGAYFAPFVLVLMYIMYPVAYPIAMLLDYILGQDHGTVYKKSGLKTLVTLHKTMGVERLNQDEVTIISSVLDLKAKPVSTIMTPIGKVYTLPSDRVLDEEAVEEIFNAGFSRIPIHLPGEPTNFVGMLLVRILISYDPEDSLPVSSFPLATLPETSLETSCLNILNYFQEGKSHMVVVSETPGMDTGAIGVLTLEDVIEELIGEEIIDESDVYIDLNKNIKRSIPGPLSKRNITTYLHSLYGSRSETPNAQLAGTSLPAQTYFHKRSSVDSQLSDANGMKPSNLAINPLQTTNPNVKIKKQPQLVTFSMNDGNAAVIPRSDTPDYGSVHQTEAEAFVQGVHDNLERSEAPEQLVQLPSSSNGGPGHKSYNNSHQSSQRQFTLPNDKKRRNSVDLSDAKSNFVSNNDGIPLPRAINLSAITNSIGSGSSAKPIPPSSTHSTSLNGLVENIVSVRGVSKTVIEES